MVSFKKNKKNCKIWLKKDEQKKFKMIMEAYCRHDISSKFARTKEIKQFFKKIEKTAYRLWFVGLPAVVNPSNRLTQIRGPFFADFFLLSRKKETIFCWFKFVLILPVTFSPPNFFHGIQKDKRIRPSHDVDLSKKRNKKNKRK